MNSGVIFAITQDWRGDTLTIDAAPGDAVLQVKNACDFDEVFPTARYLVVGDETTPRQYIASDLETNTVTLADVIGGTGLEAGLPVVLWDPTVGTTGARTVEYVARVELHDGSGAPDVVIPHEMIPAAGVFNLVGASVTIDEDDDGDLVIGEVLGRENVSDGAYVALEDGTTLEDIYAQANAAAAAAADAAANATTALTAANGKNKVTYSLSTPGATPNTSGDIWFQKDSATQTIIGQWIGGGGTTWVSTQLRNEVIANLDAGKLVAGSAFTNALSVKTNFTLGDGSTNGVIQSYNFAGSSVGVYIDKFGLVAKGGSIAGASITGSTLTTGGSFPITISGNAVSWGGSVFLQYGGTSLQLANGSSAVQVNPSGITLTGSVTFGSTVTGSIALTGGVTADGAVHGDTIWADSAPTTGAAINGVMGASGQFLRNTSSRRYKYDEQAAAIDIDAVLQLQPKTFKRYDDPGYDPDHPELGKTYTGVIAEDAEALGLDAWVAYYDDQVDGFDYPGFTVALLAVAQRQAQQITDLTARIEALEA